MGGVVMQEAVLDGEQRWTVEHGNCLELLRDLPDDSVDSCVTDPPYGLGKNPDCAKMLACWLSGQPYHQTGGGFMGRDWDSFIPGPEYWRELYRVLKPGAHIAVFGGTRTWDLIGLAIRMAGFEIRDTYQWVYASGFPKSLNISKAIDSAAGAEREVVGRAARPIKGTEFHAREKAYGRKDEYDITSPATPEAQQWSGWGTALKPSHEPIIIARKPVQGTVAQNVLRYGTGGINIDGCRVAHSSTTDLDAHRSQVEAIKSRGGSMDGSWKNSSDLSGASDVNVAGRWPPNLLLDPAAAVTLDQQSGDRPGMSGGGKHRSDYCGGMFGSIDAAHLSRNDSGGASRFFPQLDWEPELDDVAPFFYCAKAAAKERDAGLGSFPVLSGGEATDREDGSVGTQNPRAGAGRNGGRRNPHPTVKPVALMRWLTRLITPPSGVCIDLFTGSGTTGVAAYLEGFRFIGFELNDTEKEPFASVARARITHVAGGAYTEKPNPVVSVTTGQQSLF